MNCLRKGCLNFNARGGILTRLVQSNASLLDNCSQVQNRNPRNLELLTIARKPDGYHLDAPGHKYWNKLYVNVTGKHIEAGVTHHKNGPIVTVSTKEWALKNQLYKTLTVATFSNIGKILAQRCLESGIVEVFNDIDATDSQRYTAFLEELTKGGIKLEEQPMYVKAHPLEKTRMLKPWTVED